MNLLWILPWTLCRHFSHLIESCVFPSGTSAFIKIAQCNHPSSCEILQLHQLLFLHTFVCLMARSKIWRGSMKVTSRLTHCIAVQQEEAVCIPSLLHGEVKGMSSIQVCLLLQWTDEQFYSTCPKSPQVTRCQMEYILLNIVQVDKQVNRFYHRRHVSGPHGECVPVDIMQEGGAVLPEAIDELAGQGSGELEKLIRVEQRSYRCVHTRGKWLRETTVWTLEHRPVWELS